MYKQTTAKPPARRLLTEKFWCKITTVEEDSNELWKKGIFKQHELSNFRMHYDNMRNNPPRFKGMDILCSVTITLLLFLGPTSSLKFYFVPTKVVLRET